MIDYDKVTEIFCIADEFCQEYDAVVEKALVGNRAKRPSKMSKSEVITIMAIFHLSGFRTFKHFYVFYVKRHMGAEFPRTVSYNRFTELMQQNLMPLALFLKTCCLGECSGISFIDSTPIRVCKNKRIKRNRVFKGIADTGKSSMGWFHGFKLHIVINDRGEILNFTITRASTDDRAPLQQDRFLDRIFGKLYGDKGYLGKDLAKILFVDGVHLITHIRSNMKNCLMTLSDKINLRKRSLIETVNDELKNICQAEHSRHRSFGNFLTNLLSSLVAYSFLAKKPSLRFESALKTGQLALF